MSKDKRKKSFQFWRSLSENVNFDDYSLELQNMGLQLIYVEGEHHIFAVDESEVISLQDVHGKVIPN